MNAGSNGVGSNGGRVKRSRSNGVDLAHDESAAAVQRAHDDAGRHANGELAVDPIQIQDPT